MRLQRETDIDTYVDEPLGSGGPEPTVAEASAVVASAVQFGGVAELWGVPDGGTDERLLARIEDGRRMA